ncbi:MAG: hypothetical protein COB08_005310 [Rhodobacteraceae bacterium]|nr:hypothetical protein [Paracoccaceae bacterium]
MRLSGMGVQLHLPEVKRPVMGSCHTDFIGDLTGEVFLTQIDAVRKLAPDRANMAMNNKRRASAYRIIQRKTLRIFATSGKNGLRRRGLASLGGHGPQSHCHPNQLL